jgi:hypothetical protein
MTDRSMFLNCVAALALLAGASPYVQPVAAATITFDDLSDNGLGTPIANGYQGLSWANWFVLDTPLFTAQVGPNGAATGTVSPPNIAFNGFGDLAIFNNNVFTLNSADFTAFWHDNLQVTVIGKLNGITTDTITFGVSATAPTLETFNWTGINEVDLSTGGGTHHAGYLGEGTEVAVDNLTITTPEPSTLAIVGAGLAGLGLARRRRKAAAQSECWNFLAGALAGLAPGAKRPKRP